MAKSARVETVTAPTPARWPGLHWYAVAGLIVLLGWGAMEATLYLWLNAITDRMMRAVVPGDVELALAEPGTYTIFHEYRSVADGRRYDVGGVSGLIVNVRANASAQPLALKSASGLSYDSGDKAGRSLFEFDVPTGGAYRLVSSYGGNRREPQTVLAVARDYVKERATAVLVAELCAFGSIGLAALIALTVFAKRRAAQRAIPLI